MKARYWIAGVVVAMTGAGAVGIAVAKQGGHGPQGHMSVDFAELDINGDGKVTMDELEARKKARFEAADTDGDGKLSATEATAHRDGERAKRMADRIGRFIERHDSDGDGLLSYEEFGAPQKGSRMFARVDADGDGVVTEEEFAAAKAHRGWHSGGRRATE